jgi:hypothetical protein
MTQERLSTPRRRAKKPTHGYACSRCDKLLPSPEAGNAHLEKKHNGEGFLVWRDRVPQSALDGERTGYEHH